VAQVSNLVSNLRTSIMGQITSGGKDHSQRQHPCPSSTLPVLRQMDHFILVREALAKSGRLRRRQAEVPTGVSLFTMYLASLEIGRARPMAKAPAPPTQKLDFAWVALVVSPVPIEFCKCLFKLRGSANSAETARSRAAQQGRHANKAPTRGKKKAPDGPSQVGGLRHGFGDRVSTQE
jgi:hypothetical protein